MNATSPSNSSGAPDRKGSIRIISRSPIFNWWPVCSFGYLSIPLLLLAIWLLTFFLYDRGYFMIFSAGQFRMHLAIGMSETAYETLGLI